MMNILITGSTGYIGRRLLKKFLDSNTKHRIKLLVSDPRELSPELYEKAEVIEGNTFNNAALAESLKSVHTAYYLIHSMRASKGDFSELDRISAQNFLDESIAAGVKRIIYLGGLGGKNSVSKHLASREETGEILSSRPDKIETIWFRAAVIIGAGGASYEIVRDLVDKLPVMIAPKWVKTATQPIAVDDVISYLTSALTIKTGGNAVIDIGAEKMTFLDMLKTAADIQNLKRYIIPIPLLSPKLSSYWLIFITPVPYRLASALVAGLKSESVIENSNAVKFFPAIKPLSYAAAMQRAVEEEENEIISRWSDGSGAWFNSGKKAGEITKATHCITYKSGLNGKDRERIWKAILSMGGTKGWLSMNILWKMRGHLDKFSGGPGMNRGRRSGTELRIGDSLDFWKVVDIVPEKRLLLFSQMKLPGKGWLEFCLNDFLVITAHFIPIGIYGRLYWYLLYPFHEIIFRIMIRKIIKSVSS